MVLRVWGAQECRSYNSERQAKRIYVRPSRAGNWDVIKIDKGTCEEKELALVSTEVECKEAALKLGESFGPSPPSAGNWPYCFYHTGEQIISLGSNDDRPARIEKENFGGEGYGLCKKGTVHTTATLVLEPP